MREITSAAAGEIPVPNDEAEVTAVPANSTPIAPAPVVGLYLEFSKRSFDKSEDRALRYGVVWIWILKES